MARICSYFLEGRCRFGNVCRDIHQQLPPSDPAAYYTAGAGHSQQQHENQIRQKGSAETVILVSEKWDEFAWKGSPIGIPGSVEAEFPGIDLCMEEVRWECYRQPKHEWPAIESSFVRAVSSIRHRWLSDRGVHKEFSADPQTSTLDAVGSSFNQPQFNQQLGPLPSIFAPRTVTTLSPSSSPAQCLTQQQFVPSNSTFSQQQSTLGQYGSTQATPFGTTSPGGFGSISLFSDTSKLNGSFMSPSPAATPSQQQHSSITQSNSVPSEVSSDSQSIEILGKQAMQLMANYGEALKGYSKDDLIAFLQDRFEIGKIPLLPPPAIPELM